MREIERGKREERWGEYTCCKAPGAGSAGARAARGSAVVEAGRAGREGKRVPGNKCPVLLAVGWF